MVGRQGSNSAIARGLMREAATASLATLGRDGAPFVSYVLTASAADGSPILLLSDLAVHSANLAHDSRASLLLWRDPPPGSDSAAALRLTLTGTVLKSDNAAFRRAFLARHPDAVRYADFTDFSFYRFDVADGYLVAGFGRIVALPPADLLQPRV